MTTTNELMETIVTGLASQDSDTRNEALSELGALCQRIADLEALSDAVEELARIEKSYTRLPDNTWPEWDSAYDTMYAINQKLCKS